MEALLGSEILQTVILLSFPAHCAFTFDAEKNSERIMMNRKKRCFGGKSIFKFIKIS